MANFITTRVIDLVFNSGEHLPEEDSFLTNLVKSSGAIKHKKAISFAIKTILRTGCLVGVDLAVGTPQPDVWFD